MLFQMSTPKDILPKDVYLIVFQYLKKSDNMLLLRYLPNLIPKDTNFGIHDVEDIYRIACFDKNLDVINCLFQMKVKTSDDLLQIIANIAIEFERVDIIDLLLNEKKLHVDSSHFTNLIMLEFIQNKDNDSIEHYLLWEIEGIFNCARQLFQHNFKYSEFIMKSLIKNKNLLGLKWIFSKYPDWGKAKTSKIAIAILELLKYSTRYGTVEILEYFLIKFEIKYSDASPLLQEEYLKNACSNGLPMLKFIVNTFGKECLSEKVIMLAIEYFKPEILTWLEEEKCPFPSERSILFSLTFSVIGKENLNGKEMVSTVKWLIKRGFNLKNLLENLLEDMFFGSCNLTFLDYLTDIELEIDEKKLNLFLFPDEKYDIISFGLPLNQKPDCIKIICSFMKREFITKTDLEKFLKSKNINVNINDQETHESMIWLLSNGHITFEYFNKFIS